MFGRLRNPDKDHSQSMALPQIRLPRHIPVIGGDKKEFMVSVQRLDSSHGSQSETHTSGFRQTHDDEHWQPGFWNRFPWVGFTALWVVILASVASIIVLFISDEKSEHQWPHLIAPNVVLAGLNNAANIAITVAVGQGIAIAWWRKALQGATVKELHHSWAFSSNLSTILFKYKYFNAIALAAITTKLAVIDGMLYQKATSTYSGPGVAISHEINVTTFAKFPATAYFNADGKTIGLMDVLYTFDIQNWLAAQGGFLANPINGWRGKIGSCIGSCNATMQGIGFAVHCEQSQQKVNYGSTGASNFHKPHSAIFKNLTTTTSSNSTELNQTSNASDARLWSDLRVFSTEFTQSWPDPTMNYTQLNIEMMWYENTEYALSRDSCPAMLHTRSCELRPALLNYQIYISNYTVTTDQSSYSIFLESDNYKGDGFGNGSGIVELLHPYESQQPYAPSTLGGMQQALQKILGSKLQMTYTGENGWEVQQIGTLPDLSENYYPAKGYCDYDYVDPMQFILPSLNTLTFLTAWDTEHLESMPANPNPLLHQKLNATQIGTQIYYKSHNAYLFGALASTLVCILCILPAYWGFWELGRAVSLGPFEIANALRAPVFEPVPGGAGHVREVLKAVGRQKVRYGEMLDDSHGGKKLAFS